MFTVGSKSALSKSLLDPVRERSISDEECAGHSKRKLHDEDITDELNEGFLEKIPVQNKETVIVVTSTVQEQNVRKRRWTVLKVTLILIFMVWLIWALFMSMAPITA